MEAVKVDNNYAVIIDNWYSEEEYKNVLNECQFTASYSKDPKETAAATDNGVILKQNKAVFIADLFREFNQSFIGRYSLKSYNPQFVDHLKSIDPIYHYLRSTDKHDCLISYYEEAGYYKAHTDQAIITQVTWLYEEPKAFKGGNLVLRDINNNIVKEIECIANRSVLFPSFMSHEVTNISMDKEHIGKTKGRFTVSQFSLIAWGAGS